MEKNVGQNKGFHKLLPRTELSEKNSVRLVQLPINQNFPSTSLKLKRWLNLGGNCTDIETIEFTEKWINVVYFTF